MQVDTLIAARWIIPVEPEGLVLEHHAVVVNDGRIIGVLPVAQALALYQPRQLEELPQHALIPGFVNAHTHAAMTLMRGVANDLPLMDWLQNHIWPLEQRWVSESFVRDGNDLAMAEMIRGGITCFNDMYFYPEITAKRVIVAGMRATIGLIVADFPTAWASGPDEYFSRGLAVFDELRAAAPLVQFSFAPHAPYTVSDPALGRIRTLAAEMDLSVHIHLHETANEIDKSIASHGVRPLKRLQRLEFLGPQLTSVHMTQLTDEEIILLAQTGVNVVHCPESNMKLASGFCPVARLLEAGINVALGTDGAASNNDLDLMGEMRTAALLAKVVAGDAGALPAARALSMATLNGAKALGLEHEIGSLKNGKSADIAAVNLNLLENQPLHDPISDLVYSASRHQISDVWVAGRRLLKNRELTTLDSAEILARCEIWLDRLSTAQPSI
ncbi:TRZ/ATZ family hydrolase [Candidatus Methylospira mobilis]|uniref:5-methylthioadenosine/S-adenosylhomocysteine deaminase n=1 Tax=Candidatus Methylospira mobilis TaxID=1808979 RepID=A0A5Q0BNB7_9GAMM|nr:TRZ/ATZ family hydrolase [Candidatus Methylospira mobilis]QFY43694.1 TRZ/ATZ family hydrolase [Candidatus Methylospira mobilis]WNV04684.1 TRZ/ATZ family hydrolase [Candidatus Methylospira mobilis]